MTPTLLKIIIILIIGVAIGAGIAIALVRGAWIAMRFRKNKQQKMLFLNS